MGGVNGVSNQNNSTIPEDKNEGTSIINWNKKNKIYDLEIRNINKKK